MVVIFGLEDVDVLVVCVEVVQGEVVSVVNFNVLGQVVIVGVVVVVECVIEVCKVCGVKCVVVLLVSVLLYCELMCLVVEQFVVLVESLQWQVLKIVLVQNVSVVVLVDFDMLCCDLLVQLYSLVCWVESIQLLVEKGVIELVECGLGKVLVGFNRCCVKGINIYGLDGVEVFVVMCVVLV